MNSQLPTDYLLKIIVIGEANVGKTSLIKRYVNNEFNNKYKYTIGVDFALKQLEWGNTTLRLQLWDIAGQERFGLMTHVYYRETTGACIVFDCTSLKSFQAVRRWKVDVDEKIRFPNNEMIPCILLANKCDLPSSCVTDEELNKFSKENGFVGYFRTSAKEGNNVEEAMSCLVKNIILSIQISGTYNFSNDGSFKLTASPKKSKQENISQQTKQETEEGCCFLRP